MASEGVMFLIAVYVDDILLAGRSHRRLTAIKQALSEKFQVKDLGELHYFLGVKVVKIISMKVFGLDRSCAQKIYY